MTKAAVDRDAGEEGTFCTRRLGKIRVINIENDVEVYELFHEEHEQWQTLKEECEAALKLYLEGKFRDAVGCLARVQLSHPSDGPSLVWLARAVNCMYDPNLYSEVWILDSK
jgi:hypothetical protein